MALELVVVTPEGEAFSDSVDQVVLRGASGDFGVLESHERFLTPLAPGPMQIQAGGSARWAALSSGFAEVDGARVVVLVDSCALASEIDPSEAEARRAEAEALYDSLVDNAANAAERARLAAVVALAEVELDVVRR